MRVQELSSLNIAKPLCGFRRGLLVLLAVQRSTAGLEHECVFTLLGIWSLGLLVFLAAPPAFPASERELCVCVYARLPLDVNSL